MRQHHTCTYGRPRSWAAGGRHLGVVQVCHAVALVIGLSFARGHTLIYDQPESTLSGNATREANLFTALVCTVLGTRARTLAACRIPRVPTFIAEVGRR